MKTLANEAVLTEHRKRELPLRLNEPLDRSTSLAVLTLVLLAVAAANAAWWPRTRKLNCPNGELGFVDAGVGPPRAVCGASAQPAGAVLAMGGKLDLNRATEADLTLIPGVGPSLARGLVRARPFASWSDVDSVPGVGASKMEILQTYADLRP